jgi:O-antigen/teichoic acid export membrane protein
MRALLLTAVQLGAAALSILVNIFLVFYLRWGILGAICANTFGIFVISLWGCWQYFRHKAHNFVKIDLTLNSAARSLLITGFPFIPNILLAWILSSGNRWLLSYLTTMDHVGIFSLADMVGQMFNLCVLYPLSGSYVPYMLQQFTQHPARAREIDRQNRKIMWLAMGAMTLVISLGVLLAYNIGPFVLPARFLPALTYMWFILLGYIFYMGTYFSSCYLLYRKKTWLLLGVTIISAIINIVLNLVLIPLFSVWGCVFAALIAYILFFVLNLQATSRSIQASFQTQV